LGEDYVRNEAGEPIEFRTGAYDGETPYEYYGKTLEKGDLYENKFVISKVKATNGKGFVTRVWINDYLGLEVYDPNILGGEGKFAHFLIDNITGTTVTAYSLAGIEDYQDKAIAEIESFDLTKYSTANGERVTALITEAKEYIRSLTFIEEIKEYTTDCLTKLNQIWTIETENIFEETKVGYVSVLTEYVTSRTYAETELSAVQALLSEATNTIQTMTEADGFTKMAAVYADYYAQISAILTKDLSESIAAAKINAKEVLESITVQFKAEDYTEENYAKILAIQATYSAKIDECTDMLEIEAMPYLAQSEMWAVESKADVVAKAKKIVMKARIDKVSEQRYNKILCRKREA
jgi:hypothetical protein